MRATRTQTRSILLALLAMLQLVAFGHVAVVHADLPAGVSKYVALTPFRLMDTRPGNGNYGYTHVNANTMHIDITHRPGVPTNATAAVVNITIIGSSGLGYLTAFPSGASAPISSNVNADTAGRTVANLAHVKIGVDGGINLLRTMGGNIAMDLVGVYVPVAGIVGEGRFVPLNAGAKRVLDTRDFAVPVAAGSVTNVDLTPAAVPANADAVVVNITAVNGAAGFWTAYTYGLSPRPNVSTLNLDAPGETRSSQAIVPLNGVNRTISVYSERGGHLLVDVAGWFTGSSDAPSSDGLFVPSAPLRVLDTRKGRILAPWGGSTFEFATGNTIPTAQVAAAVVNITGTSPWDSGYVTAYPAGVARPTTSNLNLTAWPQTIANHAIVRISTRGAALYTNAGMHMIADVAGWYLGPPVPAGSLGPVPTNPNYAPNRAIAVSVPKLGLLLGVRSGTNLNTIANQGYAATWSDLVNVATPGNVMLFAHRTTPTPAGSGPFRYINLLRAGDGFTLVGSDGHYYNYRVVYTTVTAPYYTPIANLAAFFPPVTAQLVACSKPDGTPTSTSYRIVVTGRLVSVS